MSYFSDYSDKNSFTLTKTNKTPGLLIGDILYISVGSSDPESSAIFNIINSGSLQGTSNNQYQTSPGYLIDQDGCITFPKLGKIAASGKTKSQLKLEMEKALLEYLKDPIVTIRNLNYKVTLLGEVARPGNYSTQNERLTILDALSQAGDLTDFGRRDNILIIREKGDQQEYHRINLNIRASIDDTYFYLQPNDIVYVEPIKSKKFKSSTLSQLGPFAISSVSLLLSILIFANK
ncbi:MAG: polysaccharide export protein [Sphingobacteriaceae bacterium]|nr:polysaccharide export protein [Sphingobacteriaceae bacterium]